MKVILSYFNIYFKSTLRSPTSLFFTLFFPALFLWLLGHQWGHERQDQIESFVIFLNYAVQTVAFMQLGLSVSQEKNMPWFEYLRTLPVSPIFMVLGRIFHTFVLCLLSAFLVFLVGHFFLKFRLETFEYLRIFSMSFFGIFPMATMGMAFGYIISFESCRSVLTLLNLFLFFWTFALPDKGIFSYLRHLVPTYAWKELTITFVNSGSILLMPLVCMFIYFLVFLLIFTRAYRNTER